MSTTMLLTQTVIPLTESHLRQAEIDVLKSGLQNDATAKKAGDAFNAVLGNPEVTKRAYEEIKTLANTIRTVRGSFQTISIALGTFDFFRFRDENGRVVQLGGKWKELSTHFEKALHASVEVAPGAVVMMNKVKDILGGAAGAKRGDLKARLQAFMRELKVKEAEALDMKNHFQDLADRIRIFWSEVELALAIPLVDAARKALLNAINARLHELSRQLIDLQQKLNALQVVALSKVAIGGAGAAMAILALCPSAFTAAMESAFRSGEIGNIIADAQKQKQILEAEIATTIAKMGAAYTEQVILQIYQQVLQNPKRYIDEVAVKVEAVVNIWQTINLDMHALYTDLELNVDDNAPVTAFLIAKMTVAKEMYGKLAWLLDTYVEALKSAL
ncbi:uncharacterized protein LAESUDRAFT_726569 [Laetiporus sulphureus 93-53]|uniref:Haemolytic enterotoxin (HBL) n=1 Tax=Laetiporus sulphureus 93-53 TaxID=1314785 RepID=A0A165E081_9APHY|nr:uncharacterized protein LAESUDRAFT_726569 [Laetiporus sulphureus 93-53]KZT05996.1 hypothetical protein LAESUDRAFT_726569 [Laetiporus sulphureus 93-53]